MEHQGAIALDIEQQQLPIKDRIKKNRKCRDIAFLVLFVAFGIGMIVNSSYGYSKGDPRRLVYGLDYKGNLCGSEKASPNLKDFDVRYWLNPNQVYQSGLAAKPINLIDARSICLKHCPSPSSNATKLSWVCDYPEGPIGISMQQWADNNYDYFEILSDSQKASSAQLQGPCYPVVFHSTNLFWSCQFSASASNASLELWKAINGTSINEGDILVKAIHKLITAPVAVVKRYAADLGRAWPVLVVCGGIAPLVLSLIWLLIVRYFVGVMTWITVALLNLTAILVMIFCYIKAGWIGTDAVSALIGDDATNALPLDSSQSEKAHLKVAAIAMTALVVVLVLVTVFLIKRLVIAIAVLKVSAKAVGSIPSLIVYPVVPFLALAIFYTYWVSAALYLFSAGEVRQNACHNACCAYDLLTQTVKCEGCCGYDMHYTRHVGWAIFYHIFGCFWITQFVIACSLTTIAGAVATYYWARGQTEKLPFFTVVSSAKNVMRYSLGSMAIGSLIVAIIEMVKFILNTIRRKLKALEAAPGGCVVTMFWWGTQCCLGCIEWIFQFINRNAYIMIAISGKGFCSAAGKAAGLIVKNFVRVGTVNLIGGIVVFMGKMGVSFASSLFAFYMLDARRYKLGHGKVSSPLVPAAFCWVLGYSVASLFFAVVEMTMDTIILSFCMDVEENDGVPLHAPPLLMETLSKHSATPQEEKPV